MEAYCVKCKEKRVINNPEAVYTANGTPATQGTCPVCGTKLFRMGRTEAHAALTPPEPVKKEKKLNGKLVIVESPAKARTVGRYLGKGYTVKASVGHVRDLLRSQLSIDVENNFEPKYRVPNEKRPIVKEIKKLAQNAEEIYLATDPDREGEAIAWHLQEAAEIDPERAQRVVFHEITKPAIEEAFAHTRHINRDLVDAQQARRVLDRLVGYNLSPLLWEKVRSRLSAGRVQSAALRIVVEREREIEAFTPEEYWTIHAELNPEGHKRDLYKAKLARVDDEEPVLANETAVKPVLEDLERAAYLISKIKKGERRRKPAAPYTTSTLQQEASRRLGYTTRRTMAIAQQLYEGIDLNEGGSSGLITYMRTDSTNVSALAQQEARQFILNRYGEAYLPVDAPVYKTKAQGAQEAHEAIRPTEVARTPESIQKYLSKEQFRVYQLIWLRFVASQMEAAVYDTVSVEVEGKTDAHAYLLRASGATVRFSGFLVLYEETKDEDQKDENGDTLIPASLEENQKQHLKRLIPEQKFTQPPPRFTEASLVKTLEENGVGRPSTYAPILSTLQQRNYVVREQKRLAPTETGFTVNDLITQHFPDIVDIGFTARMEEELDRVASGEEAWVDTIRAFYGPFAEQLEKAQKSMPTVKAELETIGKACPECGSELVIRYGRFGKFISCSKFPECRYTEPWLEKIGVGCPKDGGELVERRTRKGRVFYGCANYPGCDFTTWKRPLAKPCPNCQGLLVAANKTQAQCLQCEETFALEQLNLDEINEMA